MPRPAARNSLLEKEKSIKGGLLLQVVLVLDHREQFGRGGGGGGAGRLEMHAEAAAQLRNLGVTVDVRPSLPCPLQRKGFCCGHGRLISCTRMPTTHGYLLTVPDV